MARRQCSKPSCPNTWHVVDSVADLNCRGVVAAGPRAERSSSSTKRVVQKRSSASRFEATFGKSCDSRTPEFDEEYAEEIERLSQLLSKGETVEVHEAPDSHGARIVHKVVPGSSIVADMELADGTRVLEWGYGSEKSSSPSKGSTRKGGVHPLATSDKNRTTDVRPRLTEDQLLALKRASGVKFLSSDGIYPTEEERREDAARLLWLQKHSEAQVSETA